MLDDTATPLEILADLDAEESAELTATEALADALRAASVPAAPEPTTEQDEADARILAAIRKGAGR